MDEAMFIIELRRDFYKMKLENPESTFEDCVVKYLDDGFDLEGMMTDAWVGYNTAKEQIDLAEADD